MANQRSNGRERRLWRGSIGCVVLVTGCGTWAVIQLLDRPRSAAQMVPLLAALVAAGFTYGLMYGIWLFWPAVLRYRRLSASLAELAESAGVVLDETDAGSAHPAPVPPEEAASVGMPERVIAWADLMSDRYPKGMEALTKVLPSGVTAGLASITGVVLALLTWLLTR